MADSPKTFWGSVFEAATAATLGTLALPLAAVAGATEWANGGKFSDGAGEVADAVDRVAADVSKWGDKYSGEITMTAIQVVGKIAGAEGADLVDDAHAHHPHSS